MAYYVSLRHRFDGAPGFSIFYPADGAYYSGGLTAQDAEAKAAEWNACIYDGSLAEDAIALVMADLRAAIGDGQYEVAKTYRSAWQFRKPGGEWYGHTKTRAAAVAAAVEWLGHDAYCALSKAARSERIAAARAKVEATAAPCPVARAPAPRAA